MASQKTGIADIPVEVLIDNILPFCEVKDVFSIGCANKFFALVTADDMLWKRRLAVDYNFTGSETARTSGWKFIYKRLRNPRVFVWGYVTFLFSFHHVARMLIRSSMRARVLIRL
jgi:SCF-associated factor 1